MQLRQLGQRRSRPSQLELELEPVTLPLNGSGLAIATGGFAVEATAILDLDGQQHRVGGYADNPRIGERRNGVWSLTYTHNGKLPNFAYAWAVQSICEDDPAGVDALIATNQSTPDKRYAAEGGETPSYTDGLFAVAQSACEIDWSLVLPLPELQQP